MGFVEIQFSDTKFLALLETLASIAPNPFPTFDFLPKDQLIRSVKFGGQPAFGPPSGLTQTPGTLLISLPVTINHVSIDQLEAKPNDAGTDVSATLWAEVLMVDGASVAATVVRVDVGKQHHTLPVPISLTSQAVSVPLDGITIHKGGLLRDADRKIVVVRLAMSAGSAKSLLSTPVMDQVDGQDWAIFIDPNVLTSLTLDQFEASLAEQLTPKDAPMPFPDGIVTEDAPAVVWTIMPDGSWGMTIVVGFLAIDACPTLIGDDVNMSVGVTAKVEVTPNIEKQRFDLKLHITHNVSDWDSLRCGLQNLLAGLLLSLTDPFLTAIWDGVVGPFAAALVVTAMPQLAEYMAGGIVADQDFGNEQFEKLNKPEGDDDATYTGTLPMPMFPGGTIESAVVDVFGLTVRGSGPLLLQGLHQMTITPSIVSGGWDDGYSCSTFSWVTGDYVCMPVSVTDTVRVLNAPVAHPKVILFGTTEARPKKKWKAELNLMAAEVTVVPKTTPEVATDGKLWVHSSAGLASVPIAKVGKRRAAPTGAELVSMKTGCTKAGNEWAPGHFNVKWLVDPPPTEAVVDVLRQWVLQAPDLGRDSTIDVTTAGPGMAQKYQLKGGGTKNAIGITTPSTQTLDVTVGGSKPVTVVVSQRALVAFAATELDAPVVGLSRSPGGGIAAHTQKSVAILAADGTALARRRSEGATSLARERQELAASNERPESRVDGKTTPTIADRATVTAQVRTLTLEGERVVVALGSRIFMTRPWGARRNIIL